MEQQTAEKLLNHSRTCGGVEFTKSTVQRDEITDERYIRYQCMKCHDHIIEIVEAAQQKAA